MTESDRRLIEDYLPIEAISAEASREKSVRKGHISTMHLWWARRPLVACRAAVYGALVPVTQFVPNGASDDRKKSLGRANAAKFVKSLCLYPGSPQVIREAQGHLMNAHAHRLTQELEEAKANGRPIGWKEEFQFIGDRVTVEDISQGHVPRPRVLDMFAGGGAIPLEALRLGCDSYALDLNPVAHVIELCTLVYPQTYGRPDPNVKGMAGAKNGQGKTTWGGLAQEIRYWGNWVFEKVTAEIGDLYPLIPDPEFKGRRKEVQHNWFKRTDLDEIPPGYLVPVAYLWTRTVRCKNPGCGATVPLVKQTWLCKKHERYVALRVIAPKGKQLVNFEVVEARSEKGLGFDPSAFSERGNATCPWCKAVADDDYVKQEGLAGKIGVQMMAIVSAGAKGDGKNYHSPASIPVDCLYNDREVEQRLVDLCRRTGLSVPDEPIVDDGKNSFWCTLYGYKTWGQIFSKRQNLALLELCAAVKAAREEISRLIDDNGMRQALAAYLGLMVSRTANFSSTLCLWNYTGGRGVVHSFSHQAVPVTWDYPESNPFYSEAAGWAASIRAVCDTLQNLPSKNPCKVLRGNARIVDYPGVMFDAVITDPPYYDNISYADLSDFFYIWLRRALGDAFPEHFSGVGTPKKNEIVSDNARHDGNKSSAREWFEENLRATFAHAGAFLKPNGSLVCVYAHKTTLGWATLVDALRSSNFEVTEAWPLATERPGGMKVDRAMLASSIFLVARKRDSAKVGNYENEVQPELEEIVHERVETLWDMGVSGADLVIACVGAGLRAFTRFARVEYANGEEVPAARFLSEVETVVLEVILARLSREVGGKKSLTSLAGVDPATRFYILWRYTYRAAELEAGEAIIFANGTHVELDGVDGLSAGARALVAKRKGKYRLLDFTERGDDDHLGKLEDGQPAPLVDALHRTLWLMENRPVELADFLREAQPNREQMRLVAQALAGPVLKGGELADVSPTGEFAALAKLTANWRSVIEDTTATVTEREARRAGQGTLFGKGDNR